MSFHKGTFFEQCCHFFTDSSHPLCYTRPAPLGLGFGRINIIYESVPHSDGYYSLNVLLGFARNPEIIAAEPYDRRAIFKAATGSLRSQRARIYALEWRCGRVRSSVLRY